MVSGGANVYQKIYFFSLRKYGPGVCLGDGQTEAYLKDMDMASLAFAWAMARRRPKDYRHKVDAATRCSGVSLTPDLKI